MNLEKKRAALMEKMGQILCKKFSDQQIRNYRRRMQHARRRARAAWEEQEVLIAEQMERDKVMREYQQGQETPEKFE